VGKRILFAIVGVVTEEIIRNYIANQDEGKDEIFRIEE